SIVNSLKKLGKSYSNQELVRKISRCLPKTWTPNVMVIEEAKDLSTLSLEHLLGSLMTHETMMKNHEHVQKGKKAFKNKFPQEEESSKREEPTCYECKKSGHFKNECPNLKKKEKFKKEQSKKKKAFVATWDDIDPSSSGEENDEEVANIAFMEIEEDEDEVNFSFDELQDAYENLFHEYKNVCIKNKSLKKDVFSMSKELENLKNENSKYINDIESLKFENSYYVNEIEVLNKTFSKFSNSSDKLDNLLGLQRCVFDKAGLGYDEMNNVRHFNNFFVKKN
ncbi:LOW QUALITY PROTEIN: zf-CCHC domain-containing protein/UBN2 domain-containing protein, partial [Cephalotus follicularis]